MTENYTSRVVKAINDSRGGFDPLIRVREDQWDAIAQKYKRMEEAIEEVLTWGSHDQQLRAREMLAEALSYDPLKE